MSLRYENGNPFRPYLSCDADGCSNRLVAAAGNFDLGDGIHPTPESGWITVETGGRRRDYCPDHAERGDR